MEGVSIRVHPKNIFLVVRITIRAFGRRFYPKRLTSVNTHIDTDSRVNHARRQPASQEQLGFSVLLRDTSTIS